MSEPVKKTNERTRTSLRYRVVCESCGKEQEVRRSRAATYKVCSAECRVVYARNLARQRSHERNAPAAEYAIEHGIAAASAKFGIPYQSIYKYCTTHGIRFKLADISPHAPTEEVDLALEVMKAVAPGWTWSQYDIAEVTGLSPERIRQITQKALLKLRNRISREDAKELSLYLEAR